MYLTSDFSFQSQCSGWEGLGGREGAPFWPCPVPLAAHVPLGSGPEESYLEALETWSGPHCCLSCSVMML